MLWPIASELKDGVTTVRFQGHLGLDALSSEQGALESLVRRTLGQEGARVLFDMSHVASVHPLVLAHLARLAASAIDGGAQVQWSGLSPRLHRLFHRVGLDARFPVHRSETEALRELAPHAR
ncbi:MAG: STAS domain-containing protein [Acidobacteriia bacterium]|nr:STAS domain-containing protein [Terriglobia bacterium]